MLAYGQMQTHAGRKDAYLVPNGTVEKVEGEKEGAPWSLHAQWARAAGVRTAAAFAEDGRAVASWNGTATTPGAWFATE